MEDLILEFHQLSHIYKIQKIVPFKVLSAFTALSFDPGLQKCFNKTYEALSVDCLLSCAAFQSISSKLVRLKIKTDLY